MGAREFWLLIILGKGIRRHLFRTDLAAYGNKNVKFSVTASDHRRWSFFHLD